MIIHQGAKRSSKARALSIFGLGSAFLYSSAAVAGTASLVYTALQMPDSLVANWLVRPLAAVGIVTVSGSATIPVTSSSTTTTTPSGSAGQPASPAIAPMKVGINIGYPTYSSGMRAFSNLASGSGWKLVTATGTWQTMPADRMNADFSLNTYNPGETIVRYLATPTAVFVGKSADIICRWQGVASFDLLRDKIVQNVSIGDHQARFTWVPDKGQPVAVLFKNLNMADPLRNLDCREADASPTALYDPTFLANVKKYYLVRFMDWQNTNNNPTITWAKRTTPNAQIYSGYDGVAVENMIELANQTKTNPWFTVPWNADDDYVRRFAQVVRDRLDPSLTVYVELSNEVWNYVFSQTAQAQQEGLAEGLSSNGFSALLYRYAEKSGHVLDIWKDVFNGQSSRLVRVVSTQNGDWNASQILNFRDTASKVDAVATAPYFAADASKQVYDPNNPDAFFNSLKTNLDNVFNTAVKVRAVAAQKGKRYITYEGGQHVTGGTVDKLKLLETDKRMGQLYKYYLTRWQQEIGDNLTLYSDVGGISQFGAWGMQEYLGQPLSQAPKAQTVNLFIASINNK